MLSFGSHICSSLRFSSISIFQSRTKSLTIRCIISLQDRCMPSLTKPPKPTRNEVDLRLFPRESTKLTCNEVHKIHILLVVSIPLKNMKVSWDDDIPNIWKVIIHSCLQPPTRYSNSGSLLKLSLLPVRYFALNGRFPRLGGFPRDGSHLQQSRHVDLRSFAPGCQDF